MHSKKSEKPPQRQRREHRWRAFGLEQCRTASILRNSRVHITRWTGNTQRNPGPGDPSHDSPKITQYKHFEEDQSELSVAGLVGYIYLGDREPIAIDEGSSQASTFEELAFLSEGSRQSSGRLRSWALFLLFVLFCVPPKGPQAARWDHSDGDLSIDCP